jgi:hypothetical protein
VIDRGTCTFVIKAKNAQDAGAIGCILVNNVAGVLAPGGADPTIVIPVIGITQTDGSALKTAMLGGPTNVTLRLHPTLLAGAHPSGRMRMFAPNPFQSGSSVSHFDVSAFPNVLMEPAINADLGQPRPHGAPVPGHRLVPGQPVATQLALVSAEVVKVTRAALRYTPDGANERMQLHRRELPGDWELAGDLYADGTGSVTYRTSAVRGRSYSTNSGSSRRAASAGWAGHVDVPLAGSLAIARATGNTPGRALARSR